MRKIQPILLIIGAVILLVFWVIFGLWNYKQMTKPITTIRG
ncbi:hypothetical protein Mic7113_0288 [Allocoleopsis franciscana PCC 7113]|uniref:Uncharacterized protein n=1 Tax=Allocoleopsis franciscana PCC 7113 TaxID=1173027 RepID=K9W7M8_9CYAN|nr:hypothetical protein Mic7113_0288 [Allocoleopsis franciscana PCC 7113]